MPTPCSGCGHMAYPTVSSLDLHLGLLSHISASSEDAPVAQNVPVLSSASASQPAPPWPALNLASALSGLLPTAPQLACWVRVHNRFSIQAFVLRPWLLCSFLL